MTTGLDEPELPCQAYRKGPFQRLPSLFVIVRSPPLFVRSLSLFIQQGLQPRDGLFQAVDHLQPGRTIRLGLLQQSGKGRDLLETSRAIGLGFLKQPTELIQFRIKLGDPVRQSRPLRFRGREKAGQFSDLPEARHAIHAYSD